MNNLKAWMLLASPEEQNALAQAAGTTRHYLYVLANDEAEYGRKASAELAGRIENGVREINAGNPRLPPIRRPDLCRACRSCPYAERALGNELHASEFRVLEN